MNTARSLLTAAAGLLFLTACDAGNPVALAVFPSSSLNDGTIQLSAAVTTTTNQETGTNATVAVSIKNLTTEAKSLTGICAIQLRVRNSAGAVTLTRPATTYSCLNTDRKIAAGATGSVPWREFNGVVTARDVLAPAENAGDYSLSVVVRVGTDTTTIAAGSVHFVRGTTTVTPPPPTPTVTAVPSEANVADIRYHVEFSAATSTIKLTLTNTTQREFNVHGAAGAACTSTLSGYTNNDQRNRYNSGATAAWTYGGCAFNITGLALPAGASKTVESPAITELSKYSRLLVLSLARDATSEVKQIVLAP